MAVTWNIKSTSGLGTGYKDMVKSMANGHGYGSLYEATRGYDDGGNHTWKCKTKKWFKRYQFKVYTRRNDIDGTEVGGGFGPDVTQIS